MHWSKSRHTTFTKCPRKFFYGEIASHRNPDIGTLSENKSPQLIRHDVVRKIVSSTIKMGPLKTPSLEVLVNTGREILAKSINDEYKLNAEMSIVEICLSNFVTFYESRLKPTEYIYVTDGNPVEFVYNGISMMALPEFVANRGDLIEIYSWKTGSFDFSNEEEFRLKACGLTCWARSVLKILDKDISVVEVFLRSDCKTQETLFSDEDIRSFIEEARSVSEKYGASAKIRDFPANADMQNCRWCEFKGICPEYCSYAEADYSVETLLETLKNPEECPEIKDQEYSKDVFLSHVSEDKKEIVRPFARLLEARGISYWIDEAEIKWGDGLTKSINRGLRESQYIICFLSKHFLERGWPEAEIGSMLSEQFSDGKKRVLPIIVSEEKAVLEEWPLLKNIKYQLWNVGKDKIVEELMGVLNR